MENTNEPQPIVPEVVEPTVQMTGNDQAQSPVEEPVTETPVEAETLPEPTFSIQDFVQHDPEPDSGMSTFVSYTGYWRKQVKPSMFEGKEGTIQEQEGDFSQGSNQMETSQAEKEGAIPQSDEPPQAQEQEMVEAKNGEESEGKEAPQEKRRPEPSKEDTLEEVGEEPIQNEVDLGHPIIEEGSSTESEASEDLRRKVEKKKKARTLISIEQREQERQAEEKRLANERKRKGKGIAAPSPHRSWR